MSIVLHTILNYRNSIFGLGFFLLFFSFAITSYAGNKDTVENKMTVMKVILRNKAYAEITFSQSQRFYKLLKKSKYYSTYIQLLKWSEKNDRPVIIKRRSEYSDTILTVKKWKTK